MGVMGSLFPQPKITEDQDAGSDGRRYRLGAIDLESGTVSLQPTRPHEPADDTADQDTED